MLIADKCLADTRELYENCIKSINFARPSHENKSLATKNDVR